MTPKQATEVLELAQSTLGQWIRYRDYFMKGMDEVEYSEQDEAEFLETTSVIAQNLRRLGERLDEKLFPFKKDVASQLIKSSISIEHFGNLPEADKRNHYKQWHLCLIYMSRTVGALKFISEGYVPKALTARKGKKKKKGGGPVVPIIVTLLLVGGLVVLLNFLGIIGG